MQPGVLLSFSCHYITFHREEHWQSFFQPCKIRRKWIKSPQLFKNVHLYCICSGVQKKTTTSHIIMVSAINEIGARLDRSCHYIVTKKVHACFHILLRRLTQRNLSGPSFKYFIPMAKYLKQGQTPLVKTGEQSYVQHHFCERVDRPKSGRVPCTVYSITVVPWTRQSRRLLSNNYYRRPL